MSQAIETRILRTEIRLTGNGRTITGAIPYNQLSEDLGGFREVLNPGCFAESLKTRKVLALWSHDQSKPLGSTENRTLEITDAAGGLTFAIRPPDTSWARDALEAIRSGVITGCSFGFRVTKEEWEKKVRHVISADLMEISPVSMPAYPSTSVAVRHRSEAMHSRTAEEAVQKDRLWKILEPALAIKGKVEEEKRQFTPSENGAFIEAMHRYDAAARQVGAPTFEAVGLNGLNEYFNGPVIKPDPMAGQDAYGEIRDHWRRPESSATRYLLQAQGFEERAFNKLIRRGPAELSREELRALSKDIDPEGGFTVPAIYNDQLIKAKDRRVYMRPYSTILRMTKGESISAPMLDADPSDPTFTSEIRTGGSADTAMSFELRQLTPKPVAKRLLVSNDLIDLSQIDVPALVIERLGYKFAIVEEKAFIGGSGANQPLGVMTVSDSGISTNRDCSIGNTASEIKPDGLIEALFNLKEAYQQNARWLFHRSAIKMIRKMKDGSGDYLWRQGLAGAPNTILDKAYGMSEYMPSTFTTGQYVGIVGDFSFYWIAESLPVKIAVLDQLYAETAQTGFIGRQRIDAMPVLEAAFTRVKLG